MLRLFLILCVVVSMTACTVPSPEDVMQRVPYTGTITARTNKIAYLNWQIGKQQIESDPTYVSPQAGLIGAIIVSSIDSAERKRNPSKYNYSFGKAQQVVFITSLRDALVDKKVFKQVLLEANPVAANKDDVFIAIYFKSTHAGAASDDYRVTLDTVLIVKRQHKPDFERTYFVESDPDTAKDKSFKGQQLDASEKLLAQLMQGIDTALR